jgi:ATP-binding cassette subfamily B protein
VPVPSAHDSSAHCLPCAAEPSAPIASIADASGSLIIRPSLVALVESRRRGPLYRLWTLLRVEPKRIGWGVVWQTLQAVSHIPFTAGLGYFIDRILPAHRLDYIGYYALANLALLPVHGAFALAAYVNAQRLVRATVARLRRLVVDQMQRLSLSYYATKGAGALSHQVTLDMNRVEVFLEHVSNALIVNVAVGAATLVYLFTQNPILAWVAVMVVPVQLLLVYLPRRRARRLQARVQARGEGFSERMVELVAGMRVIKSFGNERHVRDRIVRQIDQLREAGLRATLALRSQLLRVDLVSLYVPVLVASAGGCLYLLGRTSIGQIVAFVALLAYVQCGFSAFSNAYEEWTRARPHLEAVLAVLDSQELEAYRQPRRRLAHVTLRGDVRFRHVSFAYPGQKRNALTDVTLYVPAGQRVGLVGESGAGKSTLLDLLLGFYPPTSGKIAHDGLTIAELGLRHLRRATAIMGQDAFLWDASIRENIRFGRPQATDAQVEAAARRAQATGFIERLEEGYDTRCGERGGRLSGGQRQRIALARLFLRNPSIVVLDEPTSALDMQTEARLERDLVRLCAGRTTFIVAHRLSTLRSVDRVLVFEAGRIIEDGAPDELLANRDTAFARLHALATEVPRPRDERYGAGGTYRAKA